MRLKKLLKSIKGLTLTEIVVVVVVFGVIMSGAITFFTYTVGAQRTITQLSQAQDHARQAFTYIKMEGSSAYMAMLSNFQNPSSPQVSAILGMNYADWPDGTLIYYADGTVFRIDEITGGVRDRRHAFSIYEGGFTDIDEDPANRFNIRFRLSDINEEVGDVYDARVIRAEALFNTLQGPRRNTVETTFSDEIYLQNLEPGINTMRLHMNELDEALFTNNKFNTDVNNRSFIYAADDIREFKCVQYIGVADDIINEDRSNYDSAKDSNMDAFQVLILAPVSDTIF